MFFGPGPRRQARWAGSGLQAQRAAGARAERGGLGGNTNYHHVLRPTQARRRSSQAHADFWHPTGRSGGSTSRQERPGPGHRRQATPDHHRGLGARRALAALISPGHSGPAAQVPSCLTRAGHRPVVWPHEIPDSGISHRNAGSSPSSGTEAGDIPPVFAALEHAARDFTTLGKKPLFEYSSPPSDTFSNSFHRLGV